MNTEETESPVRTPRSVTGEDIVNAMLREHFVDVAERIDTLEKNIGARLLHLDRGVQSVLDNEREQNAQISWLRESFAVFRVVNIASYLACSLAALVAAFVMLAIGAVHIYGRGREFGWWA